MLNSQAPTQSLIEFTKDLELICIFALKISKL